MYQRKKKITADFSLHFKLSAIRKELGWTQMDLAHFIGCGGASLQRWEQGKPCRLRLVHHSVDYLFEYLKRKDSRSRIMAVGHLKDLWV